MTQRHIEKGFIAIPADGTVRRDIPALSSAMWTTPAEAISWGQDMVRDSGVQPIELKAIYIHREYQRGVLIREF